MRAYLTSIAERCLSYDEKPLLLFQKLKETGHKPVFMLRHIVSRLIVNLKEVLILLQKDIKSPVYIAHIKQAQKLGFPPNTTATLLPKIKPATDTSLSPTKPNTFKPAIPRTEDGQTPNGTAFPGLPSPGLRDGDAGGRMSNGQLVDPDGSVVNVTYGVAIYPYVNKLWHDSSRTDDRLDIVEIEKTSLTCLCKRHLYRLLCMSFGLKPCDRGSTYVIRSKNKGWYIVNRDPDATGIPNNYTQGWVPAGERLVD